MRRLIALACGALGAGVLFFGCSSDSRSDAPADASPPPPVDSGRDTNSDAGDGALPDPPPPPGLPTGWVLDRTYSNQCAFYVPSGAQYLPPPVAWEPCSANVVPSGAVCRTMVTDWDPPASSATTPGGAEAAWRAPNGTLFLTVYRNVKPQWGYSLVAEADGPVHSAILETNSLSCTLGGPAITDGRYSLNVLEYAMTVGGGFIAGDFDHVPPTFAVHFADARAHNSLPTAFGVVDLATGFSLEKYSWPDGQFQGVITSPAQDDGNQQGLPITASGAMFLDAVRNVSYMKIRAYTPDGGVADLLSPGGATALTFANLGTDGTDMVWIRADGHTSSATTFDTYTFYTAPFTTNPSAIAPRRLRSEQGPALLKSAVVGCGYAARDNGNNVRLVRLSDGVSWILPGGVGGPWNWSNPIAVTCDEVFARVYDKPTFKLARVRIDSLGAGIPPD